MPRCNPYPSISSGCSSAWKTVTEKMGQAHSSGVKAAKYIVKSTRPYASELRTMFETGLTMGALYSTYPTNSIYFNAAGIGVVAGLAMKSMFQLNRMFSVVSKQDLRSKKAEIITTAEKENAVKDYREAKFPSPESAILIAKDFKIVQQLIQEKVNLRKICDKFPTVTTIFQEALVAGNVDVVKEMISNIPEYNTYRVLKCVLNAGTVYPLKSDLYDFLTTTDLINVDSLTTDEQCNLWETAAETDEATESIQFLKDMGLDINVRNSRGKTPLISLSQEGNDEACINLLKAGANPMLTWHCEGKEYTLLERPITKEDREMDPVFWASKWIPERMKLIERRLKELNFSIEQSIFDSKDFQLDKKAMLALVAEVDARNAEKQEKAKAV